MSDIRWLWGMEVPAARLGPFIGSPGADKVKLYGLCFGQNFVGVIRRVMKTEGGEDGDEA